MTSNRWLRWMLSGFLLAGSGSGLVRGEVLQVRHDHDPWGECRGELEITEAGIEFRSRKSKHSRSWDWLEIQSFDRYSNRKFAILTWQDQKLMLGLDRTFDLTVPGDEDPLSAEAFALIRKHLEGTVTDRLTEQQFSPDYTLRAKHLHAMGGCEGTISFGSDWIVYQTDHPKHSRTWSRDREIESVWSLHRYQLEIHVFEENRREFNKTRRFRFQLKQPLDEEVYLDLRRTFLPAR